MGAINIQKITKIMKVKNRGKARGPQIYKYSEKRRITSFSTKVTKVEKEGKRDPRIQQKKKRRKYQK